MDEYWYDQLCCQHGYLGWKTEARPKNCRKILRDCTIVSFVFQLNLK